MDHKLYETFDSIHAESALVAHTRAAMGAAGRVRNRGRMRVAAVAACLAVLLVGSGGWVYMTPVSAINIETNPPIELGVNRFDRVVSVSGGDTLQSEDGIKFSSYEDAVDQILSDPGLADVPELSIAVTGGSEMLNSVENCASAHRNVYCCSGSEEELAAAEAAGLPLGKYQMLLALQAFDPSITAQQVAGMTMRQLRDELALLSGETDENAGYQGQGNGYGTGDGSGNGYGTGDGSGNGYGTSNGGHHSEKHHSE